MFKRWFAKYARAISDERERAAVYRLFCSMAGWTVAFLVMCVAVIVMALAWSEEATDANPELFLALFGGALVLWLITVIAALASLIIFKRTYKKIIARPAGAEEMPEVAAYRQKVREDGKSTAKSTLWSKLSLAAGFILAALFPHSMISFSSAAILVIGLFINYKLVVGLRQRVRPLEEEIDRAEAARSSEKAENADLSEEAENTEEETETPACPPEA